MNEEILVSELLQSTNQGFLNGQGFNYQTNKFDGKRLEYSSDSKLVSSNNHYSNCSDYTLDIAIAMRNELFQQYPETKEKYFGDFQTFQKYHSESGADGQYRFFAEKDRANPDALEQKEIKDFKLNEFKAGDFLFVHKGKDKANEGKEWKHEAVVLEENGKLVVVEMRSKQLGFEKTPLEDWLKAREGWGEMARGRFDFRTEKPQAKMTVASPEGAPRPTPEKHDGGEYEPRVREGKPKPEPEPTPTPTPTPENIGNNGSVGDKPTPPKADNPPLDIVPNSPAPSPISDPVTPQSTYENIGNNGSVGGELVTDLNGDGKITANEINKNAINNASASDISKLINENQVMVPGSSFLDRITGGLITFMNDRVANENTISKEAYDILLAKKEEAKEREKEYFGGNDRDREYSSGRSYSENSSSGNNGPSNDGPADNGPSYDGPSDNGPSNNGPSNDGPTDNGPSYDGPSSDGPSNDTGRSTSENSNNNGGVGGP